MRTGSAPRERVGQHYIDLARGYQLAGDRDRSLATLQLARETSPQQTRYHPQVRETVLTLAESVGLFLHGLFNGKYGCRVDFFGVSSF
jgi:hypothetical protein